MQHSDNSMVRSVFSSTINVVSGISSLCLFVNLILVPVLPFPTHLFLYPTLYPLLIHHFAHP